MNWGLNRVFLSDGRVFAADDNLSFNRGTYHFYYGNEDITNLISPTQKRALVADFDNETENYRVSAEQGAGGKYGNQPLDDSTGSVFVDQVIEDPFAAPIESASNQINAVLKEPAFRMLGIILLVGVGLYVTVKLSK